MKFIRILKASIITDEDLSVENQDKIYNALKRAYNFFDVDVNIDSLFDYVIDKMGHEFYSFEDKGNNFIITIYDSSETLDADSLLNEFENKDSYHRLLGN